MRGAKVNESGCSMIKSVSPIIFPREGNSNLWAGCKMFHKNRAIRSDLISARCTLIGHWICQLTTSALRVTS